MRLEERTKLLDARDKQLLQEKLTFVSEAEAEEQKRFVERVMKDDNQIVKDMEFCKMWQDNLKMREEKVKTREKEIRKFRRHGKGSR